MLAFDLENGSTEPQKTLFSEGTTTILKIQPNSNIIKKLQRIFKNKEHDIKKERKKKEGK